MKRVRMSAENKASVSHWRDHRGASLLSITQNPVKQTLITD